MYKTFSVIFSALLLTSAKTDPRSKKIQTQIDRIQLTEDTYKFRLDQNTDFVDHTW